MSSLEFHSNIFRISKIKTLTFLHRPFLLQKVIPSITNTESGQVFGYSKLFKASILMCYRGTRRLWFQWSLRYLFSTLFAEVSRGWVPFLFSMKMFSVLPVTKVHLKIDLHFTFRIPALISLLEFELVTVGLLFILLLHSTKRHFCSRRTLYPHQTVSRAIDLRPSLNAGLIYFSSELLTDSNQRFLFHYISANNCHLHFTSVSTFAQKR